MVEKKKCQFLLTVPPVTDTPTRSIPDRKVMLMDAVRWSPTGTRRWDSTRHSDEFHQAPRTCVRLDETAGMYARSPPVFIKLFIFSLLGNNTFAAPRGRVGIALSHKIVNCHHHAARNFPPYHSHARVAIYCGLYRHCVLCAFERRKDTLGAGIGRQPSCVCRATRTYSWA